MTELFLKKSEGEWTRVFFDGAQPFRLTRENPYFQQSDSYTLDVVFPLDVIQNRRFFGSLDRKDVGKRYTEYSCRLLIGNVPVMDGTAHLTQVTQDTVKLQLVTGVSALKMSAAQESQYIDELDLGLESYTAGLSQRLDAGETFVGVTPAGWGLIFHDTSNDKYANMCFDYIPQGRYPLRFSDCPKLLEVARRVAGALGFTLDLTILPEACSHIYVVSGGQNRFGRKLPHWTVKEFFAEFQNFFGSIFLSHDGRTLRLAPLSQYSRNSKVTLEPVEEYSVEISKDSETEGVVNRNIEFAMEQTDIEVVDEELIAAATYDEAYPTRAAMEIAFGNDSEEVKTHKIYRFAGHIYIAWKDEGEESYRPRCIAPFNACKRFQKADSVALRIAPAWLEENLELPAQVEGSEGTVTPYICYITMPAVTNIYPLISAYEEGAGEGEQLKPAMQSLIEGTETIIKTEEKPDVMPVVFVDEPETVDLLPLTDLYEPTTIQACLAYTDYEFKPMKYSRMSRKKWSFSLNALDSAEFHLGQLHVLGFELNRQVKHVFRFYAEQMPDPTSIFIVRNKRYGCEKIEASVNEDGFDHLMTGYFYEMTS